MNVTVFKMSVLWKIFKCVLLLKQQLKHSQGPLTVLGASKAASHFLLARITFSNHGLFICMAIKSRLYYFHVIIFISKMSLGKLFTAFISLKCLF